MKLERRSSLMTRSEKFSEQSLCFKTILSPQPLISMPIFVPKILFFTIKMILKIKGLLKSSHLQVSLPPKDKLQLLSRKKSKISSKNLLKTLPDTYHPEQVQITSICLPISNQKNKLPQSQLNNHVLLQ